MYNVLTAWVTSTNFSSKCVQMDPRQLPKMIKIYSICTKNVGDWGGHHPLGRPRVKNINNTHIHYPKDAVIYLIVVFHWVRWFEQKLAFLTRHVSDEVANTMNKDYKWFMARNKNIIMCYNMLLERWEKTETENCTCTPRWRRCCSIAEQLCVKNLLKVPTH